MNATTYGLDVAKRVFQMYWVDAVCLQRDLSAQHLCTHIFVVFSHDLGRGCVKTPHETM